MLHRVFIFISALGLALSGPVRADFRVPYQDFQYPYEHGADYSEGRGYFRPEYAEMVQRLSPETMQWVIRNYPVLGWREMDPRPFTPKPVPGDGQAGGFSYDTARRNMELESLFHFGPVPGNGTLIAELIRLDKHRVLTVNEGSRNLSVLDLEKPDVEAVIRMPWGLAALEMNLPARELYLVERGRTAGLLVYDLETYQVSDTMLVDFHPGAVLLSGDTRSLYMTDEQAGALLCWDLTGDEPAQRVMTGLEGPCLLAADSRTGTIILVSRSSGDIRLYRPRSLDPAASRMSLGGTLVAFHAPEGADRLYLASGSGTSSSVFSLSLVGRGGGGEDEARLERIVSLSAPVRRITSAEKGKVLYLLAGSSWLFRIEADKPHDRRQIDLKTHCQRVLAADGKLFVTGGLEDLFVLPEDFYQAKPERLALEMGPGPMLALGNERILVANSLSNSVTIVNTRELEEDISVLVGVLLGRMFYQDRRLVVNNLFRGNVMVYDPDNLLIEDIIPVGGSLEFSPAGGRYVVFDDSLMTSFDSPPSSVTARYDLDLPYGLRFFAPTKNTGSFLVVDQNQSMFLADLGSRFRHSGLLLPDVCMALFTGKKKAWAFFPSELALFSLGEKELAWLRGFTVRPYKMTRTYLASDGFHRFRGSELFWIAGDRLVELTSTRETVGAMREDPDTNYTYIITGRTLHVFEEGQVAPRSVVRLSGPVEDVYLPAGSEHAYLAGPGQVAIVHRESLYRWDKIEPGGSFVYVHGDELFLRDGRNRRRLVVADGYRGSVYQQIDLPLVPTDAAADHERLFLLGGAQGAVAVYVNRVDTRRLPRNRDRHAWDTDADRRAGTHR